MDEYSREDILRIAESENVKYVRLQFTDILGTIKNVEIPTTQLGKALDGEMMFDGSSIEGFVRVEESDMYLKPDFNTWRIFPWSDDNAKSARLICVVYDICGVHCESDPGAKLTKYSKEMEAMGDTSLNLGPEPEFLLFKLVSDGNPTTEMNDEGRYFDLAPIETSEDCRQEIARTLEEIGFEVE